MRAKLEQREKAILLRKQGKSLRTISVELGVAKSSVSVWCKDIILSESRIKELMLRSSAPQRGALANKVKRQKEVDLIRRAARIETLKLQGQDVKRLKDIGIALYWAEGAKAHAVDFTNSNPEMLRLMMLWLRVICQVPDSKFRVSIYYHSGQNEEIMKKYWSEVTKVPLSQFHKSIFKKEGTGQRKNVLYNGTCKVRVHDKNLLHRILTWIEQFHLPRVE